MITLTKTFSEFGEITVVQSRTKGSRSYWLGDCRQSEADRNGVSLATYVHAIFGLLTQTSAHEVLMIGCGGGTLGTMLANADRSVTIVDISPQSIPLARQYFCLPKQVSCHVEDGASFLRRSQVVFDAIIIDAFIDERVPRHLCSVDFFQLTRDRLACRGCVFMNVFLQHGPDLSADVIAGHMAKAHFPVRVLVSPGRVERNAIVMGGAVANLRVPTLRVRTEVLAEEIANELQGMRFRSGRRSWNSGAAPDEASITFKQTRSDQSGSSSRGN
jgi:spermidine synthase